MQPDPQDPDTPSEPSSRRRRPSRPDSTGDGEWNHSRCPNEDRQEPQVHPRPTDEWKVLRSTPSAPEVHARVTTLPESYLVRRTEQHWAVVGPTGLFLVGKAEDNPTLATEQTAMAAHHLRNRLADVVDVVPFVDPVVVSHQPESGQACAMVELDLLESFLCNGPEIIPEGELQLLRHHLPGVMTSIELAGGLD